MAKKEGAQRVKIEATSDGFSAVLMSKRKPDIEVLEYRGRSPQEALGNAVLHQMHVFGAEVSFTWLASVNLAKNVLELSKKGS